MSDEEILELASRVARRRSKEFKKRYPNILSVGAGYKIEQKKATVTEVPCLVFQVTRKWKAKRKGGIPEEITAYYYAEGERKRLRIPTDVVVLTGGEPQSASYDLGSGVLARADGARKGLLGAVCCLVYDTEYPNSLYALGCQHVFGLSKFKSHCDSFPTPKIYLHSDKSTKIGYVVETSALTPSEYGYGMDAALATIDEKEEVSSKIYAIEPTSVGGRPSGNKPYSIYTPFGGIRKAGFYAEFFDLEVHYRCKGRRMGVTFRRVYASFSNTDYGDSGSPLIGDDGMLYGMHFFSKKLYVGDEKKWLALSVPADELLGKLIFGGRIFGLKVGHNTS